jgi:UDP-2-acetamido-3-amino-2,3-dideoxy-glucuronate N-acetyltransferase
MQMLLSTTAILSEEAIIGANVQIWDYAQIRENAQLGDNVLIGNSVYIDKNVKIGKNCKIQNKAQIYDPAVIHDGVFVGPGAILTNDKNPRATSISGEIKKNEDWEKIGVEVHYGASIGAGAICVAPVKIGKCALVGAGAVVTKDVKDYAIVVGNPARQVGWVGPAGVPLVKISEAIFQCPKTQIKFELINSELHEMI